MLESAQIVAVDAVPFYVSAGIETTINSVVAGRYSLSGLDFLSEINEALDPALPDLGEDLLLQIIADLRALGKFQSFWIFGLILPDAAGRPEAPGGIATSGTFFSTPTGGTFAVRVYKNGGFVYESEPVDLSINRSLNTAGFSQGDVMQVALVAGGVVGWWGNVTIS